MEPRAATIDGVMCLSRQFCVNRQRDRKRGGVEHIRLARETRVLTCNTVSIRVRVCVERKLQSMRAGEISHAVAVVVVGSGEVEKSKKGVERLSEQRTSGLFLFLWRCENCADGFVKHVL